MSETTDLDTPELENTTPPKAPKKKWMLIGAVIVTIIVTIGAAALIAKLVGHDDHSHTHHETQVVEHEGHTHEIEVEHNDNIDTSDVDPQAKDIIDMQHRLESGDPRALGSVDAPVVVEVYSDFQCSHCADFAINTLTKVTDLIDNGTVRIEFNNFPVLGDQSILAARAAVAAGEQGKFWEFHDYLYKNLLAGTPVEYTEEGLAAAAMKVGVEDKARFLEQMASAAQTVQQEQANALQNLRLEGTPSIFIGYLYAGGSISEDTFRQAVAQELARYK